MTFKSYNYTGKECSYSNEKRKYKRVNFNMEIFYPQVNRKSLRETFESEGSIMEAVNLSETGICFKSKALLKEGDFITFLMKIGDAPSFSCLSVVKWVAVDDNNYIAGCEFYSLDWNQIKIIKDYISL